MSPEINAISTLLFVTVLLLLAIINIREAHLEKAAQHQQTLPAAQTAPQRKPSPALQKLGRAAVVVACAAVLLTAGVGAVHNTRQPVVNVCSWGEYIDEELITQFEEETGILVNYQTAESNEALYSLLKSGAGDYDVIVPSDYMISQLIEEDMLEKLDYDSIPNFSLIDDRFKHLPYDPANEYTVPDRKSTRLNSSHITR